MKAPGDKTKDLILEVIWWHNAAYGYDITLADVRSKSRITPIMNCRADCFRRLREAKGWSFERIGTYLGGFDHSTVNHHCRQRVVAGKPSKNKENLSLRQLRDKRDYDFWRKKLMVSRKTAGASINSGELHETA
jgi:chromosomal replication initiation ATPase DnaA